MSRSTKHGTTLVEIAIVVVVLGIFAWLIYVLASKSDPSETITADRGVLPGKVNIVCIEGHEYLYTERSGISGLSMAAMAPKFDDEGRPIKCQAERSTK